MTTAATPWELFYCQIECLQHLCLHNPERAVLLNDGRSAADSLFHLFQAQISSQSGSLVVPGPIQRYVTEIHRHLRLLLQDFGLYQAARTLPLQQQRLDQICDRLDQLHHYCQAATQELAALSQTGALPESPLR